MDESISVGSQTVWFDRQSTLRLYRDTITVPGADSCGCVYCRNFAVQRQTIYPQEFCTLLGRLGIDARKEWEAFDLDFGSTRPQKHLYGGWFLFCGEMTEPSDKSPEAEPFSFCFTTKFPNGSLPQKQKICAVEFVAEIPWVLPESPD